MTDQRPCLRVANRLADLSLRERIFLFSAEGIALGTTEEIHEGSKKATNLGRLQGGAGVYCEGLRRLCAIVIPITTTIITTKLRNVSPIASNGRSSNDCLICSDLIVLNGG
jgi:hypothetical protein